ncbi:hypothetical protein SELMODRAFT_236022 [Selaginella moellendorffii]|uniref:Large ribosomal subunit protein bL27c n=1 Tax=Selaginella moellendorffii TaxID=88036 RepID=D8T495_SELML|nr:uncharacterized protein LOC9631332 [Selaginella moellendorffii]EFJ08488.1 hypothetical protein SELMODRAFT_236022 [Selaginella moellendorffii]|eukprot:XP_002990395.1 uncharacterized protein LOC9631332 [Selaginella moellendorffii]
MASLASAFSGLSLGSSLFSGSDGALQRRNRFLTAPARLPLFIHAAHKKGTGSTKNGRDSQAQRLGVKVFGSETAKPGSIIIRQRGTKFHPGNNVGLGRDYTIYSLIDGVVKFERLWPDKQKVSVYPKIEVPENPNSRRVKKRDHFRALRVKRKAKEQARVARLVEIYKRPARFVQPPAIAVTSKQDE